MPALLDAMRPRRPETKNILPRSSFVEPSSVIGAGYSILSRQTNELDLASYQVFLHFYNFTGQEVQTPCQPSSFHFISNHILSTVSRNHSEEWEMDEGSTIFIFIFFQQRERVLCSFIELMKSSVLFARLSEKYSNISCTTNKHQIKDSRASSIYHI